MSRRLTSDLVKITEAGGGIIIDGKVISTNDLVKIANATNDSLAKLIITNVDTRTTNDLVKIATAGKGNIIFDLR